MTEVVGEVREYRFRCSNPDAHHEWSLMVKPTFEVDFNPICIADGCSYYGVYVGDNPAEIATDPVELLQH